MKPNLRLTHQNEEGIDEYLSSLNGRCQTHTYEARGMLADLSKAETKLLDLLGSKKALKGAKVHLISGGRTAKAYKYKRTANKVTAEYRSTGWFLSFAALVELYPDQSGDMTLVLTKEQDEVAVARFRKLYLVSF